MLLRRTVISFETYADAVACCMPLAGVRRHIPFVKSFVKTASMSACRCFLHVSSPKIPRFSASRSVPDVQHGVGQVGLGRRAVSASFVGEIVCGGEGRG